MKITFLFGILFFPLVFNAQMGVNTATPQKTLHVNGSLQVVKELNVGGSASTAGAAGTTGQILTSNGADAAPSWKTLNALSGTISEAYYVQGTNEATIPEGTVSDVPGVSITIAVPPGLKQTFIFTILGYATFNGGNGSQGVFSLLQDGVKVSSAYTCKIGTGGAIGNLPVPVTFLKSIKLSAGTYTFKIQYKSWAGGSQTVNKVPSNYTGYDGDVEAMLTKMQILVYNN